MNTFETIVFCVCVYESTNKGNKQLVLQKYYTFVNGYSHT